MYEGKIVDILPASQVSKEQLGLLMACARQLDMLLDDTETVRCLVQSFLSEDYCRFG